MTVEVDGPRGYARIEDAVAALREGRPALVLDDRDRENEGDAVFAAATMTPEWMGWLIRHSSGYLCAPLPAARADALRLPLMVARSEDPRLTAYTVSVDAAEGISTGISAADRTRTVRVLADPGATPRDLRRPGHVLPLRARDGGVRERAGHTEAAVDLARLAGLEPVGVIGELVHDDGSMMRADAVLDLGARFGLPVITVADLAAYLEAQPPAPADAASRVAHVATAQLPTEHGPFTVHAYLDTVTGHEHVALVSAAGLHDAAGVTPVRVHSECLTGDAFGSLRCDCGPQLHTAMRQTARAGGVVVYLRGHEGRGVGLSNKIAAYALQDHGQDTVDAQLSLGLPVDDREYGAAVAILRDLGVSRVRLLTNNPEKIDALAAVAGQELVVEPFNPGEGAQNAAYLRTKRDRLGHRIELETAAPAGKEHA